MIGTLIGDIVGSRFEFDNRKSTQFTFFHENCRPTDDSMMTLAVGQALLDHRETGEPLDALAVKWMQRIGREYPRAGYGGMFRSWLKSEAPCPYHSYGNGAAMRVGGVGWAADSEAEVRAFSRAVTGVTHDHPDGLRAAEGIAMCIYLARCGAHKEEIRRRFTETYFPIGFTIEQRRVGYVFFVDCANSVPEAVQAFYEGRDFEEVIRLAVSLGGDSDTIAAMAGSIAEAYYGVPDEMRMRALEYLDERQKGYLERFEARFSCGKKS
ncbi:MAG: ADP-ribosylglycohydrolase family protein [Clostridia bacterium]|nr:ADP-ribosylglycohydrolase family protein [Clostridia bacterium]